MCDHRHHIMNRNPDPEGVTFYRVDVDRVGLDVECPRCGEEVNMTAIIR